MNLPQAISSKENAHATPAPWVSVIILNYNAAAWVDRCLESIRQQTIFDHLQIIWADNKSTDGSDLQGAKLIENWPNALFIQNNCNVGFGGGINMAAKHATGKYLFFLNPDVWLEPACVEELYRGAERRRAGAVGLLVLDYDDDTLQSRGGIGFDITCTGVEPAAGQVPDELFMAHGFCFVRRDLFHRVGGYDDLFFLYGEELDICWRIWASGESIFHVPTARIHHRGAVAVNPVGGTKVVEIRTSESKRFYANRNHLLTILKYSQHLLLLSILPLLFVCMLESLVGMVLSRRFSTFKRTAVEPILSCWRHRAHIVQKRNEMASFRLHGDFWLLRFFTWRWSRIAEYRRFLQLGLPKIDAR